jgi:hypothetical protein
MGEKKLKALPSFASDEEAEKFVDTADLSEYDLSGFKPAKFKIGLLERQLGAAPDFLAPLSEDDLAAWEGD